MMCYSNEKNDFIDMLVTLETNPVMLYDLVVNLIPISSFIGIKEGTIYCPFHQDTNHKSAKIYDDVDGVSRVYCFGQCQTQYTSYEYIKRILRKRPVDYICSNLSKIDIEKHIKNYAERPNVDNKKIEYVKSKYEKSQGNIIDFIDYVYLDIDGLSI